MLNHECRVSYLSIELEIMALKAIEKEPEIDKTLNDLSQAAMSNDGVIQGNFGNFVLNTKDGKKMLLPQLQDFASKKQRKAAERKFG